MSYDLMVWKGPVVATGEEADELLRRSYAEGDAVFEQSPDVLRFYDELTERYPPLESFPESELVAGTAVTYWSDSPERSDRVVAMSLQWGVPDDVVEFIGDLATKHGLVLFDPAGPDVHRPGVPDERTPFGAAGTVQTIVAGLAGLLLAVVAWLLSIPILSGILIVIGLFLGLMAGYTLVRESRGRNRH
jgi:uncharacterized membrane protein